jgi:hypothetical protein
VKHAIGSLLAPQEDEADACKVRGNRLRNVPQAVARRFSTNSETVGMFSLIGGAGTGL